MNKPTMSMAAAKKLYAGNTNVLTVEFGPV